MLKIDKYTHRYIARIVLEAETPLFIGSGESSLLRDALVQKDVHGFPMIPGTSLTGVLRHAFMDKFDDRDKEKDKTKEQQLWESFFGFQAPKGKKGLGSQIKISSAYLIIEDGKIAEGIDVPETIKEKSNFFKNLPVRQHVRINDKGVAEDKGLFDNEVVYKGGRFVFEVELKGDGNEAENILWNEFINELNSPLFRLGQGTRNGYGKLSVKSCKAKMFDLTDKQDFKSYLNYNISFNAENKSLTEAEKAANSKSLTHYKLVLKPDDFFIFSAGFGDEEVDNVPVTENILEYEKDSIKGYKESVTLIPATSIKGALRHRTAFHFNKLNNKFIDKLHDEKYIEFLEANNDAVYELFGAEEGNKIRNGARGKIILNDIFLEDVKNDKIFNHVAIDRFTGGAMDGALFSEKVSYFEDKDKTIDLDIYVEDGNYSEKVIDAFEEVLKDVCKGLLPLGGMTTKGHGMFTGKLYKDSNKKFDYEDNK